MQSQAEEKVQDTPPSWAMVWELEQRLADALKARKEAEQALHIKTREHNEANINISQLITQFEHQAHKMEVALQSEKSQNETRSSFISVTSHEMRTPLAVIDGAAQRLQRKADKLSPEDVQELAGKIRSSVKRMTNIMERTLSAATMQAGKLAINPVVCDIRKIIEDCCTHQAEISKSHKIESDLQHLPPNAKVDPATMEQVFTNLLSNAVKYSPNGNLVDIKGWRDKQYIYISVRDHGVGIDEEDLPKMFSQFFRAKTSTGILGTGIGLHLVKTIIEQHEGAISLESKKGEGTTFTVRLPNINPEDDDSITLF